MPSEKATVTATATSPTRRAPEGSRGHRRVAGKRRRPRTPAATYATVVKVALAGAAFWVLGNLVLGSLTVQHQAGVAQRELTAVKTAIDAGDIDAAGSHLRRARHAVDVADGNAHSLPLRAVGLVPPLHSTYRDLEHLLDAADDVTGAGEDALGVYDSFSGGEVFQNSQVDLDTVRDAQEAFRSARARVAASVAALGEVRGDGPLGATVLRKRDVALAQITPLRPKIAEVTPIVNALPSMLGADGPRTYLVAVLNPAEMRASGGAPLSVAFIKFADGKMTIPLKGTTSVLTNINQKTDWAKLAGDPWQPKGPQRFVNTNFNPSWPVSAQQMIRAAPSNFRGLEPDAVIGIDVVVIQKMLEATGPIDIQDYGTLDATNVIQKLVQDNYSVSAEAIKARHDVNEELMSIMLSRATEGGQLVGKLKALLAAVPGRHLQVYSRDSRLQKLVVDHDLGGVVPTVSPGNLTAVYTQNTNQSKADVFLQRTIDEKVKLREDGSARVTRTVTIANPARPYVGVPPDPKIGYETRWAGAQVINLMPAGARVVSAPASSSPGDAVTVVDMGDGVDQDGRTYAQARVLMPPGGTATVSWTYVVDGAAVATNGGLSLTDVIAPQGNLEPATVNLTVLAPEGWTLTAPAGWAATPEGGVAVSVPADSVRSYQVQASPQG